MIVSIHQPQFFPWLGYFEKIASSDVFVLLDDVQFKKNEWQNRNRIKTAGGPQWLTVPVQYHFPEKIMEVKINNQVDWKKKHLHALEYNYSKAEYFNSVNPVISAIYDNNWDGISDLNTITIQKSMEILKINTPLIKSSELNMPGSSTERLVNICKHFKASSYIAGQGGKDYLDESLFIKENIKVVYQDFKHPVYKQCFGDFLSHMSIIDLLCNCGPDSSALLCTKTTGN